MKDAPNPLILRINEIIRPLVSFFQTLLLLLIAFTAVFSIAEIAARESVLSMLTGQITTFKSEFFERNRSNSLALSVGKTTPSAPPTEEELKSLQLAKNEREVLLSNIRSLEGQKKILQTLIILGSDKPNFSLRGIQEELRPFVPGSREDSAATNPVTNTIKTASAGLFLLSSDQLLAIAIMACGAVGAMITALRSDGGAMTLRALSLGLATGFVVYLAIKGGKHVFLLQSQGEFVAFNPYGSAFAGLLAGLFTERAHQMLSVIVDDFAGRLRAASDGKN